jgi:aspartate-semialdehyde dehydrogenase (non-peptidoglycan organisms)
MSLGLQAHGKVEVAVLGATGSIGQKLILLLARHPWFEIVSLVASERSQGKTYREAASWHQNEPLPEEIASMTLLPLSADVPGRLIFSALDSALAGPWEETFAKKGCAVISFARSHRMDPLVPLVVPEINADHLELIHRQSYGKGFIVAKPNCAVTGLVMALKPILSLAEIDQLHVTTLQAVSGAGYPGVPSLDILDNVIPYISGEEARFEEEPQKILGRYDRTGIVPLELPVSAQCTRVPVLDGHLEAVHFKPKSKLHRKEVIAAWENFDNPIKLPLSPTKLIYWLPEENQPQPRLRRSIDRGMAAHVGRLKENKDGSWQFFVLTHNTMRGGSGGAVLLAEYLVESGKLFGKKTENLLLNEFLRLNHSFFICFYFNFFDLLLKEFTAPIFNKFSIFWLKKIFNITLGSLPIHGGDFFLKFFMKPFFTIRNFLFFVWPSLIESIFK